MDAGALTGVLVIAVVAVVVAAFGIGVGARLAPRVERWGAPKDDDSDDNSVDDRP